MIPIFIDVLGAYFIARRYSSWSRIILFSALVGALATLVEQIGVRLLAPEYLTGTQLVKISIATFFIHSGIALAAVSIFRLFMTRSRDRTRSRDDSALR